MAAPLESAPLVPKRSYPRPIKVSTQHKNPNFYAKKVCRIFDTGNYSSVTLAALEFATVIAMDAVLVLQDSGIAEIVNLKTSYVQIKSRVTGRMLQRAQLTILLKKANGGNKDD